MALVKRAKFNPGPSWFNKLWCAGGSSVREAVLMCSSVCIYDANDSPWRALQYHYKPKLSQQQLRQKPTHRGLEREREGEKGQSGMDRQKLVAQAGATNWL